MQAPVELFVGPTMTELSSSLLAPFNAVSAPISRGDIDRRLALGSGKRVLCIADGYLEPTMAIDLDEIRRALSAGWDVWGVGSLGAARAVGAREEGMMGFGKVYRFLRRFPDLTEDDLAVLHFPIPPFDPLTISLIEIGLLLRTLRGSGLASRHRAKILRDLKSCPLPDRTYATVREAVPGRLRSCLDRAYHNPGTWRAKQADLIAFCRTQPWSRV